MRQDVGEWRGLEAACRRALRLWAPSEHLIEFNHDKNPELLFFFPAFFSHPLRAQQGVYMPAWWCERWEEGATGYPPQEENGMLEKGVGNRGQKGVLRVQKKARKNKGIVWGGAAAGRLQIKKMRWIHRHTSGRSHHTDSAPLERENDRLWQATSLEAPSPTVSPRHKMAPSDMDLR